LGDVAVSTRQLDDARAWFSKTLAVAESLATADPSNTNRRRDLSVSYERLGEVAVSTGKLDDARAWFNMALALRRTITAEDDVNALWQRELCTTLAAAAPVAREPTEQARYLEEARNIYDRLQRGSSFEHDPSFAQLGVSLDRIAARLNKAPRR
jgi:tetratricopeptide (TPR) repeat protein